MQVSAVLSRLYLHFVAMRSREAAGGRLCSCDKTVNKHRTVKSIKF